MQRYVYLIILLLLLLGAAVSGLFYVLRQGSGTAVSEIDLSIAAPAEIVSGDEVVFVVAYANHTQTPLTDAELFFRYPEGAIPLENHEELLKNVSLGAVAAGEDGMREFRSRVVGAKHATARASVELNYKSGGVSSFRKTASADVKVADVAFLLNLNVPQQALAGERIVYFLDYVNLTQKAYPATWVRIQYPDGFAYAGAEPAPTESDNIWDFGEIQSGGRGRITVSGELAGIELDTKKVRAAIGFLLDGKFYPYAESSFDTVISPPPFSVEVELVDPVEPIARLGETLSVLIRYKNNSEVPIKDAVLRAEFSGGIFSFDKFRTDLGYFDSTRSMVIWTPANLKELLFLDPGKEHTVSFRIDLKGKFPIDDPSDANFSARIVATLESINVPPIFALNKITSASTLEVKVETIAGLEAAGYYTDGSSGIVNTGPLPPQVNTETRYTIHWRIIVPANDLENVEVRAVLPTGVTPTGQVISRYTSAKPTFNEITGEVVWFIPRVPANTGVLLPAYETVFQIALVPSVTQAGNWVELVRTSALSAVDAFTERTISTEAQGIRTHTLSDPESQGKGKVVL